MKDYCKIIPCLDVKNGFVVKGINFESISKVGDIAQNAKYYSDNGADELVILDITATLEGRKTFTDIVKKAKDNINIPLTVGGGISRIEDFERLFDAGADKVSVNSAAFKNPSLIKEASEKFGSERVVCAIDTATGENGKRYVCINGGKTVTDADAFEWAVNAEKAGAGSLLITSMDADGTKNGYDTEFLKKVTSAVKIPVIASGGAGKKEHFYDAVKAGASAVLAASLFHFREIGIGELKEYLQSRGVNVRL